MTTSPLSLLTNDDLEQTVLGQIIMYDGWHLYAALGIKQEHFWNTDHQKLIRIAEKAASDGLSPDPVLLRQGGGSVMTISACMDNTVPLHEENASWMLDQLRGLARARRIYYETQNLDMRLSEGLTAPQAIVNEHLASIDVIVRESSGGTGVQDAAAQFSAATTLATARESSRRVWLGLHALDEVIDGLSPGEVLGLAARPGIGKTLWIGRYMRAVQDYEIPALLFSLEMPTAQIVTRLMQAEWSLTRDKTLESLSTGTLSVEQYRKRFPRLHICDRAGLSVAEMEATTHRMRKQHDIGLVMIDHLGLVGGHASLRPYERVSLNAQAVKDLAKRCEVPVVLAMQVSRDAGGDGSLPLTLSSTRDSGVTEEVVDYLVGLYRPDRSPSLNAEEKRLYENVVMGRVLKNRHGAVGAEVAVHIDPGTLIWTERPDLRGLMTGRHR
jgi:replicative DNA helicase